MVKFNKEELKELIKKNVPEEVVSKLKDVKTDVEACKILADNGIDIEKLQKELPDEVLNNIGGGYENFFGIEIYCPFCHNGDKDQISYQVFASIGKFTDVFRCRKCQKMFYLEKGGYMVEYKE